MEIDPDAKTPVTLTLKLYNPVSDLTRFGIFQFLEKGTGKNITGYLNLRKGIFFDGTWHNLALFERIGSPTNSQREGFLLQYPDWPKTVLEGPCTFLESD